MRVISASELRFCQYGADRTLTFKALWRDLVNKVHNQPNGFDALSDDEKQYYAVSVLIGEIHIGGFDQYFHNSSSDYYRYAELGLMRLGATNSLAVVRSSKKVMLGDAEVPREQAQRWMRLKAIGNSPALDLLDSQFYADAEALHSKLERFAIETGLVTHV